VPSLPPLPSQMITSPRDAARGIHSLSAAKITAVNEKGKKETLTLSTRLLEMHGQRKREREREMDNRYCITRYIGVGKSESSFPFASSLSPGVIDGIDLAVSRGLIGSAAR